MQVEQVGSAARSFNNLGIMARIWHPSLLLSFLDMCVCKSRNRWHGVSSVLAETVKISFFIIFRPHMSTLVISPLRLSGVQNKLTCLGLRLAREYFAVCNRADGFAPSSQIVFHRQRVRANPLKIESAANIILGRRLTRSRQHWIGSPPSLRPQWSLRTVRVVIYQFISRILLLSHQVCVYNSTTTHCLKRLSFKL